jgi:hypothetical protein
MAKPKQEPDDKAQSERFIEKARELEVDESGEAFERGFKKIVPEKHSRPQRAIERRHK